MAREPFTVAREGAVANNPAPVTPKAKKPKPEKPPIWMHRRGHMLVPRAPMDEAALDGFDAGKPLRVEIKQARNSGRHRLYWAMLALIRENLAAPIAVETLHEAIKLKLGLTIVVPMKSGPVVVPGSIAFDRMAEPQFRAFLEDFKELVRLEIIPGVNKAAFERQALEMLGGGRVMAALSPQAQAGHFTRQPAMNTMKNVGDHTRQGDVLLIKREAMPAGVLQLPRESGSVVLAHGEVTGHMHQLRGPQVSHFRDTSGHEYVSVVDASEPLVHEEHGPHTIPVGEYELGAQVEFEPEALRTVAD